MHTLPIDQIDYDALPYVSHAFPQTQPGRIAALAALYGSPPPDVETARVLELGCASGGNLIPLAARFPKARFEGVDLSDRHVLDGNELISAIGLENIILQQGDIAKFQPGERKYDFIICHGVFSWTPPAVQDAIFRLCAESLSENGLAYVSYNVFPGWNLRLIVRDICQQHVSMDCGPVEAIAQARELLAAYSKCLDTDAPYGKALQAEITRCIQMTDSHFQGEFLGAYNAPCLFSEFVKRSETHGLSYVCDAAPPEQGPPSISTALDRSQPAITGDSPIARFQAADFVSGRMFRRSILRKSAPHKGAGMNPAALGALHFASSMVEESTNGGEWTFKVGESQIKTNDPVAGQALSLLSRSYPATRSFDDISSASLGETGTDRPEDKERLEQALLRTIDSGHVTISSVPSLNSAEDDDQPEIWSVARAQLELGMNELSSRLHEPIAVRGPVRFIASLLDGTRSREALATEISGATANGRLTFDRSAAGLSGTLDRPRATALLNQFLKDLRRNGLLTE